MTIKWEEPDEPNGQIQGYRLYFMHANFTDVRTVRETQDQMEYNLHGLSKSKSFRGDKHFIKMNYIFRSIYKIQTVAKSFHMEK